MLRLRSCPRCGGDVYIDKDRYGWHQDCVQCGYIGDLEDAARQGAWHAIDLVEDYLHSKAETRSSKYYVQHEDWVPSTTKVLERYKRAKYGNDGVWQVYIGQARWLMYEESKKVVPGNRAAMLVEQTIATLDGQSE